MNDDTLELLLHGETRVHLWREFVIVFCLVLAGGLVLSTLL